MDERPAGADGCMRTGMRIDCAGVRMKTLTLSELTAMTLEPIFARIKDEYILMQMRSVQRNMDSVRKDIDNGLGAMSELSNDMINLRHQRAALNGYSLPTERRTNRIKRVLFGLFNRKSQ